MFYDVCGIIVPSKAFFIFPDYSKGFGGQYGVETDRVDQVHFLCYLVWFDKKWYAVVRFYAAFSNDEYVFFLGLSKVELGKW